MITIRHQRAPVETKAPEPVKYRRPAVQPKTRRVFAPWTSEQDDELSRRWLAGESGGQIAEALGGVRGREAVIARAHRIGLPRRRSPIGDRP